MVKTRVPLLALVCMCSFQMACRLGAPQVRADSILIESSDVEMLDPTVVSKPGAPGPAVLVKDSMFIVTGGRFEGQPALRLEGSSADLAGVQIRSGRAPAFEMDDTRILFSVTEVQAGSTTTHFHEEMFDNSGSISQWTAPV